MTSPALQNFQKPIAGKAYQALVLEDTPVAYWPMQDAFGSSSASDVSGNSRTLTLNGTRTLNGKAKNSRLGNCVSWTAASGFGSIASASWFQIVGDATIEGWVHFQAAPGSGDQCHLIAVGAVGETLATNTILFASYQNNGGTLRLRAFHETGAGADSDGGVNVTLSLNEWHHIVVTRDTTANQYEYWVDGVSIGTSSYTNDPTGGTSATLRVAGSPAAPDATAVTYQGCHYALYNAKLSAARIREHYRAGSRSSPTAWARTSLLCKFDGSDAATTSSDESSYGNVLTFAGAAQLDTAQFKFGSASALFSGGANVDRINIPSNPALTLGTGDFTIEMFFRTTTVAATFQFLYDQRTTTGGTVHPTIYINTSTIIFASGGATRIQTAAAAVAVNTWYHFCLQRVSGVTKMFLDGVQVGSSYTDAVSYLANQVTLGNAGHAPTSPAALNGWIDGVRVTKGEARYNHTGFTPPAQAFNPYE